MTRRLSLRGTVLALSAYMDVPETNEPSPADRRRNRSVANRAFGAIKAQHAAERTVIESLADGLNTLASSTPFLVIHVVWFLIWIPWNLGAFGLKKFDPFPFGLLTMVVSLEAIFLTIFVLMSQIVRKIASSD